MKSGKVKVETVLDAETYCSLKQLAAKQNHSISDLLHVAISRFLKEPAEGADLRRNTLRLLSRPQPSSKDLSEVKELDYYEQ